MSAVPHPTARRALALLNPGAGGLDAAADAEPALARIAAAGVAIEAVVLGEDHDAESLTRDAVAAGVDAVLVAGGDGTVARAARALLDANAVLGILPFGTYMNIARSLGVPRDVLAAADVIAAGRVRSIDVGMAGETPFFEAAGIGLDADAFAAGRAIRAQQGGLLLAALRAMLGRRSARLVIDVDGRRHERRALQCVVSNAPYYAWGFAVAPDAVLDDGMLDLTLFSDDRLSVLVEFVRASVGADFVPRTRRFRGRVIAIGSRDALPVHADGAIVGTLPRTFAARPRALRAYVPG